MSQDNPFPDTAPPVVVNAMPSGTNNTAGGRNKDASIVDGLKSIKTSDFKEVHKKPCAREALLAGIGLGFGIGGIRAVMGGTTQRSSALSVH